MTSRSEGWVSAPPKARVDDLHRAFSDDDVAVVLAGIAGNHSNQLLPHLDFDLIREHPKVFQGYSDITVLHWAFAKHAGRATFYGPALVPELGEFPQVLPHTDRTAKLRDRSSVAASRRTEAARLPVLANVEVGHTDPIVTLPLGAEAEVDAHHRSFRLLEAPTAP